MQRAISFVALAAVLAAAAPLQAQQSPAPRTAPPGEAKSGKTRALETGARLL